MFDELRHFLLIAEHGTFTAAARRAHLSQPALTASIRRLEQRFGARLLHRGPGGTALTAAGEALLPRATAALAAIADGQRAVAEIEGVTAGEVSVGAGATACTYLLPPILAAFHDRHPRVRFRLREAFTEHIVDAVHQGAVDLGIITCGFGDPFTGRTTHSDHFLDDALIVVAAPDFDPADASFITFPDGSPTRELLLRHLAPVEIVMELSSIAAVKGNVRAGIGKALVSRSAVTVDIAAGRLVEVRHPSTPIPRQLALIHRGVDRLTPSASALRELLLRASQ